MKDDRRDPPPFEIPDLELPVARSHPVSRAPASSAKPEQAGAASGPIELEPFAGDSPSVPLASPGAGRNVHDYFGATMFDGEPGDDFQPGSLVTLELQAAATTHQVAGSEWPTGRSPERSALSIADGEIRRAAGYPPPPSNSLLAPLYAWQVTVRRRSLREVLARVDRELSAAERSRDELLAVMVNALHPVLEAEPRLAGLLIAARQLGDVTGARGQALQALNEEYQRALAELEARRAQQRLLLDQQKNRARERAAALLECDQNHRRGDARLKRLQIEIRSAIDVARQNAQKKGLPSGTAEPDQVAKIHELQQKAAALEPELAGLKTARDQAQSAELAATGDVTASERALERLAAEQRSLDRAYAQQIGQRAAGFGQAEGELCFALAEIGRAALALRGGVAVDSSVLSAIAAGDAEVERLTRESELQLRSLDACDQAAVQRGYTVAALAAGMMLMTFFALMVAVC